MGKHEHLQELDKQLAEAQKKKKSGSRGIITSVCFLLIGFLFPLFWILGIIALIFSIGYIFSGSKRINEINLEKAKLK
jgi:uncharacterized membrane protein